MAKRSKTTRACSTRRFPLRHNRNPKAKNQSWLQLIAESLPREPAVLALVDELRDSMEPPLTNPLNGQEHTANLQCDRRKVRAKASRLLQSFTWPDEPPLDLLNWAFHPDRIIPDLTSPPEGSEAEVPKDATQFATVIYIIYTEAGLCRAWSQMVIDLVTDYAIHGNMKPMRRLPSWLLGNTFELPYLCDDKVVVALATRFSDIDGLCDQFKQRFKETYNIKKRMAYPKNPVRDSWVWVQYIEIRDTLPQQAEEIEQLADLLDTDEGDAADRSIYRQLLRRYEASQWASDIAHHDRSTPEGRRAAKTFLRQIVFREGKRMEKVIAEAGPS